MSPTSTIDCPCCQSVVTSDLAGTPRIAWCSQCGTGVTVPIPTRDVTSDGLFKSGSYSGHRLEMQHQWLLEAEDRVRWAESVLPPGATILELGAATGEFVAKGVVRGFSIIGVETSRWAAEQSRHLTDMVFHGDLSSWKARNPSTRVDAVALFHVLEHVHNPAELLRECRDVLAPGGRLLLEVPNAGSRDARHSGAAWPLALVDDHVHHFSGQGLAQLVSQQGFAVDQTDCFTFRRYTNPRSWALRRVRNMKQGHFRASKDLMRLTARRDMAS